MAVDILHVRVFELISSQHESEIQFKSKCLNYTIGEINYMYPNCLYYKYLHHLRLDKDVY